jgi:hypothetical protein
MSGDGFALNFSFGIGVDMATARKSRGSGHCAPVVDEAAE